MKKFEMKEKKEDREDVIYDLEEKKALNGKTGAA